MLNKIYKFMRKDERGITGLETAIILIAFVVVAAVFAYTALSAGLFSTQKSQEAVYAGLREAQSTLELRGSVILKADTVGASGTVKQIQFTVANVLGGEPMDFTAPTANTSHTGIAAGNSNNVVVLTYIDQDQRKENLYWTKTAIGKDDGDNLLEINEKFQITVGSDNNTADGGNMVVALGTPLGPNKKFTIEVKTPVGAILTVERTTPAWIDTVMNLH